jgi:hypothetical protein
MELHVHGQSRADIQTYLWEGLFEYELRATWCIASFPVLGLRNQYCAAYQLPLTNLSAGRSAELPRSEHQVLSLPSSGKCLSLFRFAFALH